MKDWTGTTAITRDLLNRILSVTDPKSRAIGYTWDNVGNRTQVAYADGTNADYSFDAENRLVKAIDPMEGTAVYAFDANGNMTKKTFPNGESSDYTYDKLNRLVTQLDHSKNGNQDMQTTTSWDKETNRIGEIRRNVGQTNQVQTSTSGSIGTDNGNSNNGNGNDNSNNGNDGNNGNHYGNDGNNGNSGNTPKGPAYGWYANHSGEKNTVVAPSGTGNAKKSISTINVWDASTTVTETAVATPVTGTFAYEYDKNYRMISSLEPNKVIMYYSYDSLGNLVQEKNAKGNDGDVITYQYNVLNQLTAKTEKNDAATLTYDKRGNLTGVAEREKEASSYKYDAVNRLSGGTNWKGDSSYYTFNGLGYRINNTESYKSGQVKSKDYVPDYTSTTRRDLMIYAEGETVQKHVYANGRLEQITDHYPGNLGNANLVRILYAHDDLQGTTLRYTKDDGKSFAEMDYDAWGLPEGKLLNNNNGVDIVADFTGYTYDTILDKYFAQARFYDSANKRFMTDDPIKSGVNWYEYCGSNPASMVDPLGLTNTSTGWATDNIDPNIDFNRKILEDIGVTVFYYEDSGIIKLAMARDSITVKISYNLNSGTSTGMYSDESGKFLGALNAPPQPSVVNGKLTFNLALAQIKAYFDKVFCEVTGNVYTLSGSSNEEKIWNYLTQYRKLSKIAAAGVMGNIKKESGFDPFKGQAGGGGGWGLIQWTPAGNIEIAAPKKGMFAGATSGNVDDYLLWELDAIWQRGLNCGGKSFWTNMNLETSVGSYTSPPTAQSAGGKQFNGNYKGSGSAYYFHAVVERSGDMNLGLNAQGVPNGSKGGHGNILLRAYYAEQILAKYK